MPYLVQVSARVDGAVAGGGDVRDAQVYTQEPVRLVHLRLWHIACGVQVPDPMRAHLWPPPYFAASCGGAPLEIVREHTENQETPQPASGHGPGSHPSRPRTAGIPG